MGERPNKVKESRSGTLRAMRKKIVNNIVKRLRRFKVFSVAQSVTLLSIQIVTDFVATQRASISSQDQSLTQILALYSYANTDMKQYVLEMTSTRVLTGLVNWYTKNTRS